MARPIVRLSRLLFAVLATLVLLLAVRAAAGAEPGPLPQYQCVGSPSLESVAPFGPNLIADPV
jgi:hypothetical protein